ELADVAGPTVGLERGEGVVGTTYDVLLQAFVELGDDVGDEERNVTGALAQRRDSQRGHGEPIEKILAGGCPGGFLLEVAVGRRDEANVDFDRLEAADALELALLDRAQQLDLHFDGDLADLVEEQSSVIGELEAAGLARRRAGERALLVAEQLRFHE